jgi:hypothetical protein
MINECNCIDAMNALKLKESLIPHYKADPPLFKLYANDASKSNANVQIIEIKPNRLPTNIESNNLEKELDDLLS